MPSEQELINQLELDGYTTVFSWHAEPGEEDFEHAHHTESTQIILEGDMTISDGQSVRILQVGMRSAVPARIAHSAVAGSEGCYYILL